MERIRLRGKIRRPSVEEVRQIAAMQYIHLSEAEAGEMAQLLDRSLAQFERLDELPQPRWETKYKERDPGYRPTPEEDPLNMFITKCHVKGAATGKLAGKRVGLKDTLCVAGVPMTVGSRVVEGFVPDIDATVVERLLDAGAIIVGKLNMDDFAYGTTGETSVFGATRNPVNPEYAPGGSSGGCGAAVASGAVDIAIGMDGGGSARIPAAWCGIVSIKPTFGLVPAFGMVALDPTFEHICPMARTVAEAATTLEVIAGEDPRDPQWVRGPIVVAEYSKALNKSIAGLRIGLLKEALEQSVTEPEVIEAVKEAVNRLGQAGAAVSEVSLPWWRQARVIWSVLAAHSMPAMMEADLEAYWHGGNCNLSWQEAFGRARRARSHDLPPMLKMVLIQGKYMQREYYSTYHSKAQNLRKLFQAQVDQALSQVDVLALPTTPTKPLKLVERADAMEMGRRAAMVGRHALPFNLTGHPAITVPCGPKGSLPIGLQLVARHWQESLLFQVAAAVEADRIRNK